MTPASPPDPTPPLKRSIGLSGVVRFLIVVVAALAIADAFWEGRYGLGVAGLVVCAAALGGAYWLWRSRP